MDNNSASTMNTGSVFDDVVSWLFNLIVLAIGTINTFWGNDPGYGVFILLLSVVYFPPANRLLKKTAGISIPLIVKILLGIFILWTALGVAELFDKIDLMMKSF